MKKILVFEYKDLKESVRKKVKSRMRNEYVEQSIEFLGSDFYNDLINEEEYWKEIGCSKQYGESTPWFVPSVYYENHKEKVDQDVSQVIDVLLFDENGNEVHGEVVEDESI